MNNQCLDSYNTTFGTCLAMREYHEEQAFWIVVNSGLQS